MKIQDWLTIVAIVATSITTLAAPILAEFVKSRISHPKRIPEPNQPKNAIQRISGWVVRVMSSPWLYAFFTVFNICILIWELRRTTVPIRRDDVLAISITMGAIYFSLAQITIRFISQGILDLFSLSREHANISFEITHTQRELLNLIKETQGVRNLGETVDVLKAAVAPPSAQLANPPLPPPVNPHPKKFTRKKAKKFRSKKKPRG